MIEVDLASSKPFKLQFEGMEKVEGKTHRYSLSSALKLTKACTS